MKKPAADPSELMTGRMQVVISPALMEKLDQWRAKRPGVPNRSKAVRAALEIVLNASGESAAHSTTPIPRSASPGTSKPAGTATSRTSTA